MYEPEPEVDLSQVKLLEVAVSAATALTPGVAALGVANDVAGAVITRAPTTRVSPIVNPAGSWKVTGIVAVAPAAAETGVPNVMTDGVCRVAVAGATEVNTPKPNAATVTSAMRLKVVFVDICFLSISRSREFPSFGLNQISLIRFDESHVLIHQIPHRVSGRGEETYF
jgi:hypothetical protein